jgi:hypothetical protein
MATKNVKSVNLLPEFLRTDKNSKFLSSTIDPLIQQPQLERIDGYIGSKNTPTYNSKTDFYIPENSDTRNDYQFNPALVIKDEFNNITDAISFDDLINELSVQGSNVENLSRLFKSNTYAFNPPIDWDKLVNYQEYYWLPTGPDTVTITGTQKNSTSTFTVRDDELGTSYIFTPDGLTADPVITLYRGNTYNFDISSDYKFFIKTSPSTGLSDVYEYGVLNNGTSTGLITLVVDENTPSALFYVSDEQILTQGQFVIKTIEENTVLNVEDEILGKKNYTSGTGVSLTNGMKVRFGGIVIPAYYQNKDFFVEGVGESIRLIDYSELTGAANITNTYNDNFDATPFDLYPFDTFKSLPINPDYITINRGSSDKNPWTCYNRWIHAAVIKISAQANGQEPVYPADRRAKRPIIEFKSDLKLYNFGSKGIASVDLIDNSTTDAFSTVVGTAGYYVDGILLEEGHRVIFNADTDATVRNKIFKVHYVIINNIMRLELNDDTGGILEAGSSTVVNLGNTYSGDNWWFNGDKWIFAQQHTELNQAPLFDLFDEEGNSYSDPDHYTCNFTGNKIFGYDVGTGKSDTVLGFPLNYKNTAGSGSYLFKNYFVTESISASFGFQNVKIIPNYQTYFKFINPLETKLINIWSLEKENTLPILQFETFESSTTTMQISVVDKLNQLDKIDVYVNSKKLNSDFYATTSSGNKLLLVFDSEVLQDSNVLLKIYSNNFPNKSGSYETPINLLNNPLNENLDLFTLTELTDQLNSIVNKAQDFKGSFPGNSNVRDLGDLSYLGTQLVANKFPMPFAQLFIGKKEHSLLNALNVAADQYNQFKLAFLRQISQLSDQVNTVNNVDIALKEINKDKDILSPYYYSDMVPYGTDKTIRSWTVSNPANVNYPLSSEFNPTDLSHRAVLVYVNDEQLIFEKEYSFSSDYSSIQILKGLNRNDTIKIVEYSNTNGSFIPSTPTKLGLYPKYEPCIIIDDSYAQGPKTVIQGHDGSIMLAYNDFRDNIILEFEKRIYNNIKTEYRSEILDHRSVVPGIFRNTDYSLSEINAILQREFIQWCGQYNIDPYTNNTFDLSNVKTWNYAGTYNYALETSFSGTWRSVYNYFYDTDRPHTHPWEMLGFTQKPIWWDNEYGPAPYTSGNDILWSDLEEGTIKHGPNAGKNTLYARPGLKNYLPVNESGELLDPLELLLTNSTAFNQRKNWTFGDFSPAETAWRRSSYWPFAVQKLLTLTVPSKYAALMYDPHNLKENAAGQLVYGADKLFLDLRNIPIFKESVNLLSGYSVYVSEIGTQRSSNYVSELRKDITYLNLNLLHKVGGFVSKDKLQILVDSYDPNSSIPGGLLPQEDYQLILNTSNPIKSVAISGIIVQKNNGKYTVKGYDHRDPYFTILKPIRTPNTPAITVGGVSETFVEWSASTIPGNTGLTNVDITTANSAATGKFYQKGQVVRFNSKFYRVKTSHQSSNTFNQAYFQVLPMLPTVGGATVQSASTFDNVETQIAYGTEFGTIQEIYDLIIGYGEWLKTQGFVFDQYNTDLMTIVDWYYTGKEFLFWSTQNWADSSIITLSPFADKIKYSLPNSVVNNIFDKFYEYSILQANGIAMPQVNLNVSRIDETCVIETLNTTDGIYFGKINSVQKEHAMVFNNTTMFNDTIYDSKTGYRQKRIKLTGFRTANWNGDYYSPGFIFDEAKVVNWNEYQNYKNGDVVSFNSKYYIAKENISGAEKFDFDKWFVLDKKPEQSLLPNFDYKINQFEDFYSLDIDNFDVAQQKMAQHLIGYTPRTYLNNIFTNPIAQYKFYQGFIKEKGTKNSVQRLAKASIHNLQGELEFNEEWAFRVGYYGGYNTYNEIEIPLPEGSFIENPQIINFVDTKPTIENDLIYYSTSGNRVITFDDYASISTFPATTDSFKLETAGFVRLDDVTATAYNENSLLDIANNGNIKEGDTIWLGFKTNGDWDVLRYTILPVKLTGVSLNSSSGLLTFSTSGHHKLRPGQLVSITQYNSQFNGVYLVKSVPSLMTFSVSTALTSIETDVEYGPGLIFGFLSVKINNFDNVFSDQMLLKTPIGTKFWIENSGDGTWAVYEKTYNYHAPEIKTGWSLNKKENILLASDPSGYFNNYFGNIWLYKDVNSDLQLSFSYTINNNVTTYYDTVNTSTNFGYSLAYDALDFNDTGYGLIFAGAPLVSGTKSDDALGGVRFAYNTGTVSARIEEGLVKISSIEPILVEEVGKRVLLSPQPESYQQFGHSLYLQQNATNKLLIVGAPGTLTTGSGSVYVFSVSSSTTVSGAVDVQYLRTIPLAATTGSQWGYSISGSANCETIAISAPGYSTGSGRVVVYAGTETTVLQTIDPSQSQAGQFGKTVRVSDNGNYIFIAAPSARNIDQSFGNVSVYKKIEATGTFTLVSVITNPISGPGMRFGIGVDVNENEDTLVVSALGPHRYIPTTFDTESEYLDDTTFDASSAQFYDNIEDSGSVYVYERKNDRFVFASKLYNTSTAVVRYGASVVIDNNSVFAGARSDTGQGIFYQFKVQNADKSNWNKLRQQNVLTNIDSVQKVTLIDSFNENIIDYLDVIDPLKGKIAGIADQEIKYKAAFDPAVYSIGIDATVVDTNTNWLDDHVGELWWDLSTTKYIWYEQGELTYRKNNWGRLFPGSTIDVYEWVGTPYLPSEWSSLADTPEGLTQGMSGQPKFADNSVVSVKQVYNSTTNSFTNYYYYWVKNKVTVPNSKNRRISSYQVSSIIADPTVYGLKYAAVIAQDAVALSNVNSLLVNSSVHLNIAIDDINNSVPRHTEWLLIQEGNPQSVPNVLLEKKLLDSLLGHDSLGNLVPDPALSSRMKYGISIRPRQTMFKNRFEALRNLIEFTNGVLLKNQITGKYDFANLNKQEQIPSEISGEYDQLVEDNEGLLTIDTRLLTQAELTCTVHNGKLRAVTIINPGLGYKIAPTVKILSNVNTSAELQTEIDSLGRIIAVTIKDPGNGFTVAPSLVVRPYTVIVLSDNQYNGKWTKFAYENQQWIRSSTQKYNTPLYWKYVDWQSDDYNQYQDYEYTLSDVYQLNTLSSILDGQYVKIKNGGDGRYIILRKVESNGTFSDKFDLVYSENGTIQILDSIWDYSSNNLGFDQINGFDQTLFDQTPDIELEYILQALKKDIFVRDLKINWNLFFFKAVKYALTEQKLLDWAFKTSFINVINRAGSLDQRPVYKFQNSEYYENYLKEVKPYRTNIRSFTTNYSVIDPSKTYTTDFDLPTYFNKDTNQFDVVNEDNPLSDEYPWKSWFDNFTYEVASISVGFGGSGYTLPPVVNLVAAEGDSGQGATAQAYIQSGKVVSIEVTNTGSGYKKPPVVIINGGGNTVLSQARAYAQLENKKVRNTLIGMKFDRTKYQNTSGSKIVKDRYLCDGSTNEFVLTWLADPDKLKIFVKLDGGIVLSSDYKITYYKNLNDGCQKQYSKIVFLNYVPNNGQVLEVEYQKNINLFNATERILNNYNPTSGMPGVDLPQLMSGMEYPKTSIQSLAFDYVLKWGSNQNYDVSAWAGDVKNYKTATVASTATTGSSMVTLTTMSNIAVGQSANIISYLTNKFSSTATVVTGTNTVTNAVYFSSTLSGTIIPGDVIEFWNYDSNFNILDSSIDGGTWSLTTSNYLVGALGTNPEDIIIQGDPFISENASFAPEELVPGQVFDTLGINVYTKALTVAPTIFSGSFSVESDVVTESKLGVLPVNKDSITVVFNGSKILWYTSATSFISDTEYSIDWESGDILISPQPQPGMIGYTIVSIGGGSNNTAGVLDNAILVTQNTSTAVVASMSNIFTVRSVYVTVNGEKIPEATTSTQYGYILNGVDQSFVTIINMPLGTTNTIQVWFFADLYEYFNEVKEQLFVVFNTQQSIFNLTTVPGLSGPPAAQMIVEVSDNSGRRRLLPPYVSYYDVTSSLNTTYAINNVETYNLGAFQLANTKVYVNGRELRTGFDFSVDSVNATVTIKPNLLKVRDVVAVMGLVPNDVAVWGPVPGTYNYEYNVSGSSLVLVNNINNATLRVITYTNHDSMGIRTERFKGNPSRRYRLSNAIMNDRYVWVQVNGIPLTSGLDFEILDDQKTVQISDAYVHTFSDNVVITSLNDNTLSDNILGYRVFNDIFNRTHFKRLARENSTYLTQPLTPVDTVIHVSDASRLTPPVPSKKIPGVVLINGERVEFLTIQGNVLSNLRRGTLGTSPSDLVDVNTKVIDQGFIQTIPFSETILMQTHMTTSTTNTYVISTVSTTSTTIYGDGIVLSTDTLIPAVDQIAVYYGGRLLNKTGLYYHDNSVTYDVNAVSIRGTTATTILLPVLENIADGDSYIIAHSNEIWTYRASNKLDAVNGYVYEGLKYKPPEFNITTSTQQIVLNLSEGVSNSIKLVCVKKQFNRNAVWNTEISSNETKSLLDSNTVQAEFLKDGTSELPDIYYYRRSG